MNELTAEGPPVLFIKDSLAISNTGERACDIARS